METINTPTQFGVDQRIQNQVMSAGGKYNTDNFGGWLENIFNPDGSEWKRNEYAASLDRAFQAEQAKADRDFQAEQSQIQYDRSREFRQTAYQDTIADMQKAGINPILAVSQGATSGSAGGGVSGSRASGSHSSSAGGRSSAAAQNFLSGLIKLAAGAISHNAQLTLDGIVSTTHGLPLGSIALQKRLFLLSTKTINFVLLMLLLIFLVTFVRLCCIMPLLCRPR